MDYFIAIAALMMAMAIFIVGLAEKKLRTATKKIHAAEFERSVYKKLYESDHNQSQWNVKDAS